VLNNGLTVLLIESHELPVVEARLVVRAGAAADPPEKPGLAGLTLALLDEGAGKHDARGIRRELEAAGARLDVATLADGSSLAISTLRPQAAHALEILADLVTAPAFRPADLERIRHERLNAVRQEGLSAVRAAVHAMSSSLFGDAHPYGHVAVGTENGLQSIENADVVAFHGRRYVPRNAALVLAGDLTRDDALLLAGRAFAAWRDPWAESEAQGGTALAAPEVAAPEMAAPGSGRVAIVDLPGAPRAVLFAGEAGVARSHPDFEPLMLAHRVLGDRLARALGREPNSGMFSFLPETRGQGPLVVGAIVANEGAYAAAKAALEQAAGMRERAVTGAELDAARRAALAAMTGRFETLGLAAMAYGEAWLAGLPPDSCAGYPARLMRLTAAQVSDAARRRLSPERVKVVAAGDGKAIEPGLRRLGLGAIARRRPEGAMPLAAQ
jgi:zinc protease